MNSLFWLLLLSFFYPQSGAAQTPPSFFKTSFESWHHEKIQYHQGTLLEKTEVLKKLNSPFLQDKLTVALNIQAKEKPLVVMIPGLFGNYDAVEVHRLGQILYDQGYNLLRLPNPVSRYVIHQRPKYGALDFESEGALYADIVKQIQEEYHFPQTHFVGISYGAFISAVAAAKLGKEFKGQLLLVSPPKNILASLTALDALFDELKGEFKKIPLRQIALMVRMYWYGFWGKTVEVSEADAKSTLIIYCFHSTFVELSDIHEQILHPRPFLKFYQRWSVSVRQKQSEMRFVPFLRVANGKFFDDPAKHEILYWVEKAQGHWRLFTSPDDFINPKADWPSDPHIFIHEKGGHIFGYMSRPKFIEQFTTFLNQK